MKQKLLHWARRLLKIALVLTALIALFYGIENWRAQRAWDEHLEWLKSKGETLDLAVFTPPAVPDEDNAALAPVFDCFYTVDAQTGQRAWAFRDYFEFPKTLPAAQRQALKKWKSFQEGLKPLGVFSKNNRSVAFTQGYGKFLKEFQKLNDGDLVPKLKPPDEEVVSPAEAVAGYFEQFAPMVQRIREAAQRPDFFWPLGSTDPSGLSLSPGAMKGIYLQKALGLEARLALFRHDAGLAHQDLLAQIKYAAGAVGLVTMMGGLMQRANRGKVCETTLNALTAQQWDDAQWQQIAEAFPKATLMADMQLILRGERAWLTNYYKSKTWRELGLMGNTFDPKPLDHLAMRYLLLAGPSGWKTRNLIAANILTQRRIEALDEGQTSLEPFFAIQGPAFGSPYDFMCMSSESDLQYYVEIVNGNEILQLATLAIALERFRLKTGAFPEQLTQVVPEFLPQVPQSSFDATKPHYERTSDGMFKLWFNGFDGDDDHGCYPDESNPSGNDHDLVFAPPAPVKELTIPAETTPPK